MEEKTTYKEEYTTKAIGMNESDEQTIHCSSNDSYKNKHSFNNSENISSNESTNKKKTLWNKIKLRFRVKSDVSTTYTKRHSLVNALLTIFFCIIVCMSLFGVNLAVAIFAITLSENSTGGSMTLGIVCGYYSIFSMYYTYKFIIANRKDAVFPAFIGTTFVWMVFINLFIILFVPDHVLRDAEDLEIFTLTLVLSIILSAITFSVLYLIMRIKKYGAAAWTLLEQTHGKKSKFDKICIGISLIIWLLPVGEVVYADYKVNHPNIEVKIGDYYYEDGTISSELLTDKKAVGIIFSLETSAKDKDEGYSHGQIVSLTDMSPSKKQWDVNVVDYDSYPNYMWKNRMDALTDFDGLRYVYANDTICLPLNLHFAEYSGDNIKGTSGWYVPTAGQWCKILENLGKVKVNGMLKFDAETACKNLKKADINPLRWYWTITEFDAENAWSIRVASGEFGSRTNKQSKAYVRPVASF